MLKIATIPLSRRSEGHQRAYQLLQWQYEMLTAQAMPPIVTLPGGKPAWKGGELYFNVSHTRTMAVCAISDGPVGVDAEFIRSVSLGFFLKILSPQERRWVLRQPDQKAAMIALWTLKESYVKFTGQGLKGVSKTVHFALEDAIVLPEAPEVQFGTMPKDGCMIAWCTGQKQAPQWTHCRAVPPVYERIGFFAGK